MTDILVNSIRCRKCGDVLVSTHRHDFKWCSCRAVAVDGGKSYLKRLGELSDIEELSQYKTSSADRAVGDNRMNDDMLPPLTSVCGPLITLLDIMDERASVYAVPLPEDDDTALDYRAGGGLRLSVTWGELRAIRAALMSRPAAAGEGETDNDVSVD